VFEVFKNVKYGINLKIGNIEQFVSMIYVSDLSEGIILTAEHAGGTGETYFICDDQPYSWSKVINSLKKIMKKNAFSISVPYPVAYGVAFVIEVFSTLRKKPSILSRQKMKEIQEPFWVISNQKIKSELGYSSKVSLEEGLKMGYDWYKEQNWL
jgi:nucleoside-diphosphate-sugar epimerase